MAKEQRNDYEKLIDYVEAQLVGNQLKVGDKLPAERELSAMLSISRNSVRTGLAVLEAIGVIDNKHGSGNYINGAYDYKLTQIMMMMYALDEISNREISGLRYAAELQAIMLAPQNITELQKTLLMNYLEIMEKSQNAAEQTHCDKMIHQTIVEASGNRLIIANYMALNRILDAVIGDVRRRIAQLPDDFEDFQYTHRQLVEFVCAGDYGNAKKALDKHLNYMLAEINT